MAGTEKPVKCRLRRNLLLRRGVLGPPFQRNTLGLGSQNSDIVETHGHETSGLEDVVEHPTQSGLWFS